MSVISMATAVDNCKCFFTMDVIKKKFRKIEFTDLSKPLHLGTDHLISGGAGIFPRDKLFFSLFLHNKLFFSKVNCNKFFIFF